MSDEQERLNEEAVEHEEIGLEEEQQETEEELDMEKVLDNLNGKFGPPDDDGWKKGLIAVGVITAMMGGRKDSSQ